MLNIFIIYRKRAIKPRWIERAASGDSGVRRRAILNISISIAVSLMIFSSMGAALTQLNGASSPADSGFSVNSSSSASLMMNNTTAALYAAPVSVPFAQGSVSSNVGARYSGNISVMVTFKLSNQNSLSSFLSNLSNPNNVQYHKYLTRSQFASLYGPEKNVYQNAVNYFSTFTGLRVKTYSDHVSISLTGPASTVGKSLGTTLYESSGSSSIYYAGSAPSLPFYVGSHVSQVTGLTNSPANVTLNLGGMLSRLASEEQYLSSGYPSPVPSQSGSAQYVYGSDLQVAYGEQSLLNVTYPTNQVIATILWSGYNSSGTDVGSFYPYDINAYYNATLPSYEPHPTVHGVPVNDAPAPGISSTYDVTGASFENTLDLEMVGSTAPGSNIYNVYGPNATLESINAAVAFVLNPNATYSALDNVSVITNSWGSQDYNSTTWNTYMQEAATRGITVLASSGDSGDNSNSSKYMSGPDQLWFPASLAYDNYGVTAVGGTTLTLTSSLAIENQVTWNISSSDTSDGGPAGSTGGISSIYSEPSWQLNTEANSVINGAGRGVPDISAIANNTIVYETYNGTHYDGNPYFYVDWGTSVASPLTAGMIAEMDAVLHHFGLANLGYLNPAIYSLGNQQVARLQQTSTTGYYRTSMYNYTLPMLPFYDVLKGGNDVYNATYGYDLVTGWGSINAYNFTMYLLDVNHTGDQYAISGVENNLTMSGLSVTSYLYNSSTGIYSNVNGQYNASIQQNFFLADSLGAPIYWIQNVVYINGSSKAGWNMEYTGWVVYPFYGLYPSQTIYEYNVPLGKVVSLPHTFDIKTWLSNINSTDQQTINFEVNSHLIQMSVPAASFIIATSHNYTYSWQGKNYTNGPFPGNANPGGLSPQFGLVGGPSLGLGDFAYPTGGTMTTSIEPMGSSHFIPAYSNTYNESIDQTGEAAQNLNWVHSTGNSWTLSIENGSTEQGVYSFAPGAYDVTFNETGLPSGTQWSVDVSGVGTFSSTGNSTSILLSNSSYNARISTVAGYAAFPSVYHFTVNGSGQSMPIEFTEVSNESQLMPSSTYDILSGTQTAGFELNMTAANLGLPGPLSFALDPAMSYMFVPVYYNGVISVYNTSTGTLVRNIPVGSSAGPFKAVYDALTNSVYVSSDNGNITVIDASSLTITKNISIPSSAGNITTLTIGNSGNTVYALDNSGSFHAIDASTGAVLETAIISEAVTSESFGIFYYVQDGNMYIPNLNGDRLTIVNLANLMATNITLPSGYDPVSVLPYGYDGNLLIGGARGTYEIYNYFSGNLQTGPVLNGTVLASAVNPFNGTTYLSVFNMSSSNNFGKLVTIGASGTDVVAAIPGVLLSTQMAFDSADQMVYSANVAFWSITAYNVPQHYNVTFTESGLPAGSTWYVNISGEPGSGPITGDSFSTYLLNGSFSYTVGSTDKTFTVSGGSFTVSGSAKTIVVDFQKVKYGVEFILNNTDLVTGIYWYVSIAGIEESGPLSGNAFTFHLANGTYSYNIGVTSSDYELNTSSGVKEIGTFTVNGNSITMQVSFKPVTFDVVFYENGLPANALFNVTLNGNTIGSGTVSGASGSATFAVTNGTYNYSIEGPSGFYAKSQSGSVSVSGRTVSVTLQFEHYAYITGIINPRDSVLTVNGHVVQVSSGEFNVSEQAGNYSIVVKDSGYSTFYDNFSLSSGQVKNITVNLQKISTPTSNSPPLSPVEEYGIIGGIAVLAVIGSAFAVTRRKR